MNLVSSDLESPRRPSLVRDRPSRPPLPNGPRLRSRTKISIDMNSPLGSSSTDGGSPVVTSGLTSPVLTSPSLRPGSPPYQLDESQSFSLDASLPQCMPPLGASLPTCVTSDIGVQVSQNSTSYPPSSSSSPAATPPAQKPKVTLKSKPSVATFLAPPPLAPPPTVSFESTQIPWKGLPYEAAQWTFTSSELQEIVSRAIRLSAKESFIRLLSLQALDTDMVKEAERLEEERLAAQVKWRFEMNRRTMQMQALNSCASVYANSGEGDTENVLGGLISQVATSIASCDSILASILHMSDQEAQISAVQHRHWASALGIALRKLNKAFERQGEEMKRALIRIQTLEDELEEAWREAEGMAAEIDEMEQSDEEVDDIDDNQTLGDVTINTDIAQVMGVTAKAVLSKATLISQVKHVSSDAKSIKSSKSVKSSRSKRSKDGPNRLSRLSAAKTRSRTASNASLRLPKGLRTPTTSSMPQDEPPPMPALPDALQGCSFLDMDTGGTEYPRPPRKQLPNRAPEPTVSLPEPPHTAGLPRTSIPSIWIDADSGPGLRPNGLDRSHSMQISSSLRQGRRSELVMSLSRSDTGNSPVETVETVLGSTSVVTVADKPLPVDIPVPVPVIDRPLSAVDRLVSGSMDRPRPSIDRRSSGSYKLMPLLERSTGIPATLISGGRYYSRGLPSYRSTETISEGRVLPRIGTPNNG